MLDQYNQHTALCPECHSRLELPEHAERWMKLVCPECETPLEITSETPWTLGFSDDMQADDEMFADDEFEEEYDGYDNEEDDLI